MRPCDHVWSSARRGRHTGRWLKTCRECFETVPTEAPAAVVIPRTENREEVPAVLYAPEAFERFERRPMAAQVRATILDWRARSARNDEGV